MSDKSDRKHNPTFEWRCPSCGKHNPMGRKSCRHPEDGHKYDRKEDRMIDLKK